MNNACHKNKNYKIGCHPSFSVQKYPQVFSFKSKFVMWVEILATEMKCFLNHLSKICWHLNKYKNGLLGQGT